MTKINTIETGEHQVFVGDVFEALQSFVVQSNFSRIFILVDENTREHCLPILAQYHMMFLHSAEIIEIPSGEQHKTLAYCTRLWEQFTHYHADRHSLLINLSGGVLSDMGGFAAATFKRGMAFINLPTTLLAMVDASVGGKLAIDFKGFKNHIGLFHNPAAVFVYPGFLRSLPERELMSGFAEVIKHGLIADKEYFTWILHHPVKEMHEKDMMEMIARSVEIKQSIVFADPKENGTRKILNFGHTIGHAIESYAFADEDPVLHGEAVAVGMMLELLLSVMCCDFDELEAYRIIRWLKTLYSVKDYNDEDVNRLIALMQHDKKNKSGKLLFSLLQDPGRAVYDIEVKESLLQEVFQQIKSI